MNIKLQLDNKITIEVPKYTLLKDIVNKYSNLYDNPIIGVKINNRIVSFNKKLDQDYSLNLFDANDNDGYKMYQAGLKFVLYVALKKLYGKEVDINFKHSIERGIEASIINHELNKDDIDKIKKMMDNIIKEDLVIEKLNIDTVVASNYYTYLGYPEKALNIHNITNEIICLYRLDKYINYFYVDMPYSTKVLNKYELIYVNSSELALMFPTPESNNLIPQYIHYNSVIECFDKGKNWLTKLGIPYVTDINRFIEEGKIKELIRICEAYFDSEINRIATKAINKNIKYLLLAGPSSSGKTTTAKKITLNLQAQGIDAILISTDDYFVDRDKTPIKEDGLPDYEGLNAIDIETMNKDLLALIKGEEVSLPTYDFKLGAKKYIKKPIKLNNNGMIVIEGLHCLNDELTYALPENDKYKVYLSPFIPVNVDMHNYISTTDLRLIRRIIRDNNNRGKDVSFTIETWQQVRRGEENNIFPYIDKANETINTSLAYELGVLKVYVEPLLYSIKNTSPYYSEARRLIYFLKNFFPISSEYVSHDSIIREFIGGSNFKEEGDK